jgi:serine/threonine protein kinase
MSQDLIGKKLANYQILAPLGHGGMAQVYKAEDITLKRPVAIKVIAASLSDNERYRERFQREAQSIASLEQPNIVPVYYFGQSESLYFLAMKFIEGEDLSTIMNRYASAGEYLPSNDILTIIDGITDALDYAHRKGVIHRDIKPSNIMIDSEGHIYLTDFGLALNLSQGTQGDVFGTPHYIAPEQARSSAEAVPQSDLYALGVVLYELLTGVVPFDDPSPTAVALQHITKAPPAPRALNANISPQVEHVLLKSLAKLPTERYQTGKDFANALRAALQNAGSAHDELEIPALPLPPLPPGFQTPPPRRISLRPVAAEVRASLLQRQEVEKRLTATQKAVPTVTQQGATRARPNHPSQMETPPNTMSRAASSLPLIVLAIVFVVVLLGIGAVALSTLNPQPVVVADLPTVFASPTSPPATTEPTAETITAITEPAVIPASDQQTFTAEPSPIPPTEIPQTALPTQTLIPPTAEPTLEPTLAPTAEAVVISPTAYPANWLPLRFEYNNESLWWVNESGETLNVNSIRFENVRRARSLEGNRWALFYSRIERNGGCVVVDANNAETRMASPSGCTRTNSEVNATSDENFWRGDDQFRVFWNNIEVGLCDNAAGVCRVAIPPN